MIVILEMADKKGKYHYVDHSKIYYAKDGFTSGDDGVIHVFVDGQDYGWRITPESYLSAIEKINLTLHGRS